MKKDVLTTKYLAIFLVVCLVIDGILLCWLSPKLDIWNRWMAMIPIIYMILGAFYANFMKKNVDNNPAKLNWLYIYKGIKIVVSIAMMVLYMIFVKQNVKLFLIITAACYLIALVTETLIYTDYTKQSKKRAIKHE